MRSTYTMELLGHVDKAPLDALRVHLILLGHILHLRLIDTRERNEVSRSCPRTVVFSVRQGTAATSAVER